MKISATLTYFVLLLGSAAVGEESDSVGRCEGDYRLFPNVDDATEKDIEVCLQKPEIAAVAENYTGTDDEKEEIIFLCFMENPELFSNGVLDREALKRVSSLYAEIAYDRAAFEQTLADCEPLLQETDKVAPYLHCIHEYCEGTQNAA